MCARHLSHFSNSATAHAPLQFLRDSNPFPIAVRLPLSLPSPLRLTMAVSLNSLTLSTTPNRYFKFLNHMLFHTSTTTLDSSDSPPFSNSSGLYRVLELKQLSIPITFPNSKGTAGRKGGGPKKKPIMVRKNRSPVPRRKEGRNSYHLGFDAPVYMTIQVYYYHLLSSFI